MKIRCTGCSRTLENPNWNPQDTCKNCGRHFISINTPQFPMQNPNPLPNLQSFPEIPHVYLGKSGFSTNKPTPNQNNAVYPPQNTYSPVKEERTYDLYEKIRLYGFYVCVALIIGYAAWRIIKLFIGI